MDTHAVFGFSEMLTFIIGDMAKAVSERPGETKQQQFVRSQGVVAMILDLHPRDAAEAMLAGQCVMFNAVIADSARDTLRGEVDAMRRATRSQLVAMNNSFCGNLDRLERYHGRPPQGLRHGAEASTADPATDTQRPRAEDPVRPIAPKASDSTDAPAREPQIGAGASAALVGAGQSHAQRASETRPNGTRVPVVTLLADLAPVKGSRINGDRETANPPSGPRTVGAPAGVSIPPQATPAASEEQVSPPMYLQEEALDFSPSAETIAACRANPEAVAAIETGDPARFARAMGVDVPGVDYLNAAAAPGSPFNTRGSAPRPANPPTARGKT
jgi:hypothetical protein